MTGERLKELLSKCKVSQSEIARQLGLSHQSLNQMLSSSDIKTGLVERIAMVLNVKVSFLYGEDSEHNSIVSGNGVAGNNNVVGNMMIGDKSAILQQRIIFLERLLEEKERTIKILMENKQL
jgi:transcriptional regulator with XRE-family HTH domain